MGAPQIGGRILPYAAKHRNAREQLDPVYVRAYNRAMGVEWDPAKARANLEKQGVRFADAITVLDDVLALTTLDPHSREERHQTVGRDPLGRVLTVCYSFRGENVRIISVRRASLRERRDYEGQR